MKLLRSKKAISESPVLWLIRLYGPLAIMLFTLGMIISTSSSEATNTHDLEAQIIENRIFHTLAYTDANTGRVYPGKIDLTKFTTKYFNASFETKRSIGIRLTLTDHKIIYYDEEFYSIAKPLKNTKRYLEIISKKPVILVDKDKKETLSHITISIIIPQK